VDGRVTARAPVLGSRGMVVAGHPAAALAGWRMLDEGGSVADAAIAAAAVLAVALPQACTVGGDAFALVHDAATGRTHGLNASGPAPAAATPAAYADGLPQRGARAANVPGVVAGWEALHRRCGRLPWAAVLARAIELAERGVPVCRGLAAASAQYQEVVHADEGSRAVFLDRGRPLALGAPLRQPALALTLREIAEGGGRAFYEGRAAESIAATAARLGGLLTAADFHGYAPEWVAPLATGYRHLTVRALPPNASGVLMLMQLNALGAVDLAKHAADSAERLACLMAAARAAFAEGRRALADPRAAPVDVAALLGPATTARLRDAVARGGGGAGLPNRGGTSTVSVADRAGNAVTLIQSVFLVFGSGVTDPGTGVLLNDRMLGFTTERGHPNEVAPRKRPAHTLNPVMAFDAAGRLRYCLGTPGGPGQTLTLTQTLSLCVDHGLDLAAAVEAPRWSMDLGATAILESAFSEAVVARLRALGHEVERAGPGAPFFGSVEAIEALPTGALAGVADPRRDAGAAGG
jgi:gamma-glutamyltranspeptidase/glutathione hydrolase